MYNNALFIKECLFNVNVAMRVCCVCVGGVGKEQTLFKQNENMKTN